MAGVSSLRAISLLSSVFSREDDKMPMSRRFERNYRQRSSHDRRKNESSIRMDGSLNMLLEKR